MPGLRVELLLRQLDRNGASVRFVRSVHEMLTLGHTCLRLGFEAFPDVNPLLDATGKTLNHLELASSAAEETQTKSQRGHQEQLQQQPP